MTESRRPILHLKLGAVTRPPAPEREAKPPPKPGPGRARPPVIAPPAAGWKCRPCGAAFDPPETAADADPVRCPACNAKLGLAGDFRQGNVEKLRARQVKR